MCRRPSPGYRLAVSPDFWSALAFRRIACPFATHRLLVFLGFQAGMTCMSATIARDPSATDRPFHLESCGEAAAAPSGTLMCMCRYRDALFKFLPGNRTSSSASARPGLRISKTRTENLAFEAAGRGNRYFQVSPSPPPSSWEKRSPFPPAVDSL